MSIDKTIKDLQNLEEREKQAQEVFRKAENMQREANQMRTNAEAEVRRAKAIKEEYGQVSFATDRRLKDREDKVTDRERKVAKLEAEFGAKVTERNNEIAKKESDLKAEAYRLDAQKRRLVEDSEKVSGILEAFGRFHSAVQEFNKAVK